MDDGAPTLDLDFTAEIWEWRGPSPYYFVTVPRELCEIVHAVSGIVTYGWGMIPVRATIGTTTFRTAMWPKDGGYVLPLKDVVRRAERLDLGDEITVRIGIGS
jgi:hypothetical protein